MAKVTGHGVILLGIRRAGGGAQLAKAARLRDVMTADDLGGQIRRWSKQGTPQFGDVLLHVLDYLGALSWDVLDPPQSQAAIQAAVESSKARTALLESLLDDLSRLPSADPGKP